MTKDLVSVGLIKLASHDIQTKVTRLLFVLYFKMENRLLPIAIVVIIVVVAITYRCESISRSKRSSLTDDDLLDLDIEMYSFKLVSGKPSYGILSDDTNKQCLEFCKDKYPYWDKYPNRLKKCMAYCEGKGPDPLASF